MTRAPSSRRPYLPAPDRRRRLLDAAARCFARAGYAGLTMVGVAEEAGVSRRLVYNHFPDLASLYEGYFDDRVGRYIEAIDDAVVQAGDDTTAAFTGAFGNLLRIPADDQRAIRVLVADPGLPELAPLRARLRDHIDARWLPAFADAAPDPASARALLWTLVHGLLGLADLVAHGELAEAHAVRLAQGVVDAASTTLAPVR